MRPHHPRNIPLGANNFLSVLEGIEGGFAVFVGIIAGLYFQNVPHDLLIVTGVIGLIVNAFNASAVRYASEHYTDELDGREKRHKVRAYFVPALVEFLTYGLVSLVVVIPLLLIRNSLLAILLTVALTITMLFCAGAYRGKLMGRHLVRDGVELASIGVAIILVGATAGSLLAYLIQ
jgi:VIT1/CCC1 family predicted Fe2+/Mn2+ transporter